MNQETHEFVRPGSPFLKRSEGRGSSQAFLYATGMEEVRGHSVAELCGMAGKVDRDFVQLRVKVAPLDKYYIPTRYPNGLPGGIPSDAFSEADAEMALGMTRQVLDLVNRKMAGM